MDPLADLKAANPNINPNVQRVASASQDPLADLRAANPNIGQNTYFGYAKSEGIRGVQRAEAKNEAQWQTTQTWRAAAREAGTNVYRLGESTVKGGWQGWKETPTMTKGPQFGQSAFDRAVAKSKESAVETWKMSVERGSEAILAFDDEYQSIVSPQTGATGTKKFAASGSALLGLVNTLLIPITAPFEGASAIPGIGHVADGINRFFGGVGGAFGGFAGQGVQTWTDAGWLTPEQQQELQPVIEEFYGLLGQLYAGQVTSGKTIPALREISRDIANKNVDYIRENLGTDVVAETGVKIDDPEIARTVINELKEQGADDAFIAELEQIWFETQRRDAETGAAELDAIERGDIPPVSRQRAESEVLTELENAQQGRRFPNEQGEWQAESSTFPQWLLGSEDTTDVRTREVIDKAIKYFESNTEPPARATRIRAALDNIRAEVARREAEYVNENVRVDIEPTPSAAVPRSKVGMQEETPVAQLPRAQTTQRAEPLREPVGSGVERAPTFAQQALEKVEKLLQDQFHNHEIAQYSQSNFALQSRMGRTLVATDYGRAQRIFFGKEERPQVGEFGPERPLLSAIGKHLQLEAERRGDIDLLRRMGASNNTIATDITRSAQELGYLGYLAREGALDSTSVIREVVTRRQENWSKRNGGKDPQEAIAEETAQMKQVIANEVKTNLRKKIQAFLDDIKCK